MIGVHLVLIFLFCLLLIKATDILMINLKSLVSRTRIGAFAISGLIMALGTSLPELSVGITSALRGTSSLSLGNVIGANIANLSLVIGGAALLGGAVQVRGEFLRQDVFYAFLAGAAPMVLLFDKQLSRLDGIILLALYGFYQAMVFSEQAKGLAVKEEDGFIQRLIRRLNHRGTQRELGWIFLGLALLFFSADMIVHLAKLVAVALNIPILLVGLILISIGTCLPEFAFGIKAIKEKQPQMVFGNLLGSIVANANLILGLVVLISPLRIQAFAQYLVATMAFVVVFGAFYFFVRTKHQLERWEGAFLIGFYLAFVLGEFIHP
jgi:cation:H+ antiporter